MVEGKELGTRRGERWQGEGRGGAVVTLVLRKRRGRVERGENRSNMDKC